MATTSEHIAARNDADLLDRFIAAAEQAGIPNASSYIQGNMGRLVTQQVAGEQKVADVYAYASITRKEYTAATPPRPGQNLGAVTDAHLLTAINALREADGLTTSE